ncbi:TonB-dependent receptor [Terriglobus tenax]|uniref:TonB-dependent receptor n=1 Tax=Terriglobus tenax TaxID=1111115 RepID=UPI0021DF8C85|nr:TonB-dependent receptor [Terriglobus tenax]
MKKLFLLVLSGIVLLASYAYAQGTAGSISGVVTDSTGAVIPNAIVTITNPVSGHEQTTTTGNDGRYTVSNLPFGRYHVSAGSTGFQPSTGDVVVKSAAALPLDFKLGVSAGNTVVTVESDAEDLLSKDPVAATQVDRSLYEKLPTESTAAPLSSLITLSTPGIASDSNGLFHPMGEHADTSYSIDGQPVSDQQSRVFGNQMSVNAIQSINVIEGIAPAEYGDKASLVVQTTTRSGLGQKKPTGTLGASYGTFGSATLNFALGVGGDHFGNFFSLDGVNSGRYLDTPEFNPVHAHGNNQNFFDRFDYKPDDRNTLQLNLSASRSWFQNPNQYDQQAAGQDQKGKILSYNLSPSWTHVVNDHTLFSVNPYLRQDNFHYYPSANPFNDTPATLSQSRRLQNAGIKADFSWTKGTNTLKVGGNFYHTFLHEGFSLGITDPGYNAVCFDANGDVVTDPTITSTAQCAGNGYTVNDAFIPGAVAYDLTRGGSLYRFNGKTDIKQEALYVQDAYNWKGVQLQLGVRADNYNGLSRRSMVQPRLGMSYTVPKSNTVLRAGYGKLFLTPYNENLIVSSSTGIGGLQGASAAVPLKPAARDQYNVGFEQGFGKLVVVSGEYFWKYTDRDFDFGVLFNTPLAFPIQWRKSKIDGFGIKINVPQQHGVSAYSVLGHTRSRFFGPETGGVLFNDPSVTDATVFRIDHDQAFQQTTHLQWQPKKNGPWGGFTWRYESGLVAGSAPFATDTTTPVDLTGLTADQQQQIALSCGGVKATLNAPLTSCAPNQLQSPLLSIPAPGTEDDDRNPPRIAPRTMFDAGLGWDNLFHKDRIKTNISLTVVNLTNKYALYNFLSTFSGTHFVSPRTVNGQVSFNF